MTTKHEIIKTIHEQAEHKSVQGIFGQAILNACKDVLNKPLDIDYLRRVFEAGLFLIERIKETEDAMQTAEDGQILHDLTRERTRWINSLTVLISEL
jgi:hypothetical protein